MKIRLIILSFFLVGIMVALPGHAQENARLRISLLTCTPGEELYSTFGHTAIRVIDSNAVTDIVYNYGTFNFRDPDFYSKFVQGKLLYFVSAEYFNDFRESYLFENRGITEQLLNLNEAEKFNLYTALNNNLKEENRYYKYDFTYDNCTTRARDIILASTEEKHRLAATMPSDASFRNAIHIYLDSNKHYWSKLGIDLLLGARMDVAMNTEQQQFLPDNLLFAMDGSQPPIVNEERIILQQAGGTPGPSWFQPWVVFTALLGMYILFSLYASRSLMQFADFFLFFITGLIGCLLLFMWWGTDHNMTKDNYNLLWALPVFLPLSIFIRSPKKA